MARSSISAGELNTRITVQEEVRTPDGQGGFTKAWGTAGHSWKAWARRMFVAGGDTTEQDQTVSRRRFTYKTRRRSDVTFTQAMRVLDGPMILDIKTVAADDSDLTAQHLSCEEVPS